MYNHNRVPNGKIWQYAKWLRVHLPVLFSTANLEHQNTEDLKIDDHLDNFPAEREQLVQAQRAA